MNIIVGLIGIVFGFLMVAKTESFLSFSGRIEFFDKYLGAEGGSRLGYKIMGILVIFIFTLIATDMIGEFLQWLMSPLVGRNVPLSSN